jgi:nanoRNase/pAp phosphatase (c-di-AMP/oligoRNAs hydrolase)
LASDIGHELAKDNPFGATYYYDGQKYIFSLRSDDNNPEAVDVSKIAKFYEGGGHKNAAGFELESLLILIDPKKSYGGIYG